MASASIDPAGVYPTRILTGGTPALNLGVAGGSLSAGTKIVESFASDDSTAWLLVPVNGYVELVNRHSNQCVTTDGIAGDGFYQTQCMGAASSGPYTDRAPS